MSSSAPQDFWDPIPIKPVSKLQGLRQQVITHNEDRMPKWKIRLASDLIIQIQPKVSATFRDFRCIAIECAGADLDRFAAKSSRLADQTNLSFDIYSEVPKHWASIYPSIGPGQWTLKGTNLGWARHGTPNYGLPARIASILDDGFFDQLPTLLSPHCVVCGKALSDPASMARMVGPECYGESSLSVPRLWSGKD